MDEYQHLWIKVDGFVFSPSYDVILNINNVLNKYGVTLSEKEYINLLYYYFESSPDIESLIRNKSRMDKLNLLDKC